MLNPKDLQQLADNAGQVMELETDRKITWCGNCGNYGIQNALKRALVLEGLERNDYILCFDVGCSGNGSDKFEANTIHGLHGRVLSLAAGVKLANHKKTVIASAGDGATFSEGVNHLVHSVRNDYPIVFIFHNNENYGLTTGQASSCTPKGAKMNGTPNGVLVEPLNTLDFVLSLKPTFVARGYSGEVDQMTDLLRMAFRHNGFAFIEVLQACPTYNRETPDDWYATRVNDVKSLGTYDNSDIWQARRIVEHGQEDEKVYTGLIYHSPRLNGFVEMQPGREAVDSCLVDEVRNYDISEFY
jgi:2-oxoglutarate ferredoxin oxidoreductase subunit beta